MEDNYALFDVPFVGGENLLEAVAVAGDSKLRDMLRIQFQLVGSQLKDEAIPFTEINVMLGSPRYFEDRTANVAWIPEQEYKPGSWGFVGGTSYRRKTGFGSMLGSDIDILGTDMNPIFQTQRVGINLLKLMYRMENIPYICTGQNWSRTKSGKRWFIIWELTRNRRLPETVASEFQ